MAELMNTAFVILGIWGLVAESRRPDDQPAARRSLRPQLMYAGFVCTGAGNMAAPSTASKAVLHVLAGACFVTYLVVSLVEAKRVGAIRE